MAYSIDIINTICTDLGGIGGHAYEIDGLNEICTLIGATTGHSYNIDALNAICAAMGYSAGHKYNIDALNAIVVGGSYAYEDDAWQAIQIGSLVNYDLPWTNSPFFRLPSTGYSVLVGESVTIFGDDLINVPILNSLAVTYTCTIGTQSGKNFILNPVIGDVGNHNLTILFKNGSKTIVEETISFNVRSKTTGRRAKIFMVGDSTTFADYICAKLNTVLSGDTHVFIGTQGTTYKNEGHSGYRWDMFAANTMSPDMPSPFFKAGALNIPAYFTDNSLQIPDYVYIRLGINDVFSSCTSTGDGLTNAELTTIINSAKTLIDGFLALDPNLKVIVGLPTISENTGAGWNNNYDENYYLQDKYIEVNAKYCGGLITTFANGTYNARVDCSYEMSLIDRNEGYPKTAGVHNNGVHFNQTGAEQIAVGLAAYFNAKYAIYGANVVPVESSDFDTDGTAYWAAYAGITKAWNAAGYMEVSGNVGSYNGLINKSAIVTAGHTYRMSCLIKSSNFTGKLSFNAGGAAGNPAYSDTVTSAWKKYSCIITPTANGNVQLTNYLALNGTICIDDLRIEEVL